MLIPNGAVRGEGSIQTTSQLVLQRQDRLVPFTFVCISISLLLVPDFASSQSVGSVLSEEGDDMAAGGSQGGVQRGGYAELNHWPVMGGVTDGSEGAATPSKGLGAALR